MTLTEAITKLSSSPPSKMAFGQIESLGIVLAAARAMCCERCGGHGNYITEVLDLVICPDCRDDRKKAGIV